MLLPAFSWPVLAFASACAGMAALARSQQSYARHQADARPRSPRVTALLRLIGALLLVASLVATLAYDTLELAILLWLMLLALAIVAVAMTLAWRSRSAGMMSLVHRRATCKSDIARVSDQDSRSLRSGPHRSSRAINRNRNSASVVDDRHEIACVDACERFFLNCSSVTSAAVEADLYQRSSPTISSERRVRKHQ